MVTNELDFFLQLILRTDISTCRARGGKWWLRNIDPVKKGQEKVTASVKEKERTTELLRQAPQCERTWQQEGTRGL